jgi:hypothetical protein
MDRVPDSLAAAQYHIEWRTCRLTQHGKPLAFYSDKASIFRVNDASATAGDGHTQFGRALYELNIDGICANTPAVKASNGRIFRLCKDLPNRKNALFYRTLAGAHVGDVFMSLIHTAELNHVAPFEYLVALQRNATELAANPAAWMPWNYQAALASHPAGPDPPV